MRTAIAIFAVALGVGLGAGTGSDGSWIVAGQSNAGGQSTDTSLAVPLPAPDGGAGISLSRSSRLVPTVDPISFPGDTRTRRSPWPFFAAERLQHDPKLSTVYTVHNAAGATCLVYPDPAHPGEPSWDPATGRSYRRMVKRIARSRTLGFPPPKAVLWDQGGCEAIRMPGTFTEKRVAYRDGLLRLADAIQKDIGPIPIVTALISADRSRLARSDEGPGYAAVRQAIAEAAALHPMIFVGPDQAGPEYTWESDGKHVRSVDVSGRDWARAVEAVLAATPAPSSERDRREVVRDAGGVRAVEQEPGDAE